MSSQVWWYAARSGGLLAWALLAASVLWGLALTTRVAGRLTRAAWLLDLHRFLGGAALVFTGIHVVAILLDVATPPAARPSTAAGRSSKGFSTPMVQASSPAGGPLPATRRSPPTLTQTPPAPASRSSSATMSAASPLPMPPGSKPTPCGSCTVPLGAST